jgi:hypothetical protein
MVSAEPPFTLLPVITSLTAFETDHTVYDCLFVVAWWQRFLLGEPRGRKQAAATLERMLCGPAASGTISFSPAIELLRSCTREVCPFSTPAPHSLT